MKIGVLTFHKSINNGAVMQCYSLTKRLQKEFPEDTVEVIDYHMPKVEKAYTPSIMGYFASGTWIVKCKRAVKLLMNPRSLIWQKERKRAFESVADVLALSERSIFADGGRVQSVGACHDPQPCPLRHGKRKGKGEANRAAADYRG